MDFLQTYFYGVVLLPLPRNAPKKSQEKKSRVVDGWVWDLANVRGGPSIFVLFFVDPSDFEQKAELRSQWLIFPGLACAAHPAYKSRGICVCNSTSNRLTKSPNFAVLCPADGWRLTGLTA
jgi:hypothetical protein